MKEASLLHKTQYFMPGVETLLPQNSGKEEITTGTAAIVEIPFTQIPQTGALDQQVPHSQGNPAIITIWLGISGHEEAVSGFCVTHSQTC